jgi:hypothetical protein
MQLSNTKGGNKMYTEEEVLLILQDALDYYNEEKAKNPRDEFNYPFASEQFKYYYWFVESLTKKRVGINEEGRVYLRK